MQQEDLLRQIKALQDKLEQLQVQQKEAAVQYDIQALSNKDPDIDQQKCPRGPFPKVSEKDFLEGDTAGRMVFLMREAQRISKRYNSEEVFLELKKVIPWSILRTLDPWNTLSFNDFLEAIDKRYNSLEELNIAKSRVTSFKLNASLSRTENICNFVNLVDLFNLKCQDGGEKWKGKTWSKDRVFEHVKLNLGLEKTFVAKLIDVWKTKSSLSNPESWGIEMVRSCASEAEESFRFLYGDGHKKVLLAQNTSGVPNPAPASYSGVPACFKCDGAMRKGSEGRWICGCNSLPACGICFGPHLTKFHEQVFSSIMRSQRRLGLKLRGNAPSSNQNSGGNTQGTSGNKLVGFTLGAEENFLRGFTVKVGGHVIHAVIDTGAEVSVISRSLYEILPENWKRNKNEGYKLRGVDSNNLQIEGGIPILMEIGNQVFHSRAVIVANSPAPLIVGMDVLKEAIVDNKENKITFNKETLDMQTISLDEENIFPAEYKTVYLIQNESRLQEGGISKTSKNEKVLLQLKQEVDNIAKIKLKEADSQEEKERILKEKENMMKILERHERLFSECFKAGKLNVNKVQFQFKKNADISTPRVMPLRPLAHAEVEVVNKWIKEALEKEIIEPSASTWRATIFPVKKPDTIDDKGNVKKNWRIVTPFIQLNKLLDQGANPLPREEDIRLAVCKADFFSTIDLRESFFQIPLKEDSRPFTAFAASSGRLFQYTALPMGCCISTSILQGVLTNILKEKYMETVIVYADDILIFTSGDIQKHLREVNEVLDILTYANAKVKLAKVQIGREEVKFLGRLVSKEGWRVGESYIEKVKKISTPLDKKSLRSFIGVVNWQRRYIKDFSNKIKPLTDLLKDGVKVKENWNKKAQDTFEFMKNELAKAPILKHPNFEHPFIVYSDASKFGIGGVLVQEYDKKVNIISYFSRKFKEEEIGKGIPEKEMMALVESLEDFRIYIFAKDVEVRVDQASLKWLAEVQHPHRFSNYALRLAPYQIQIKVIPGTKNKADYFSRYMLFVRRSVQDGLVKDAFYKKYKQSGDDDFVVYDRSSYKRSDFKEENGALYYKNRLVVPKENTVALLKKVHEEDIRTSHLGVDRTTQLIQRLYFWPGWQQDIRSFIKECDICRKQKKFTKPAEKGGSLKKAEAPNEIVSLDIYGTGSLKKLRGFSGILSVSCNFTGFTLFFPLKSRYATELMNVFEKEWCLRYGYPLIVHADNEFRAEVIFDWMRRYNVEQSFTGIYAPWQNGIVERAHRFLSDQLKVFRDTGNEDWVELLPYISYKLNIGRKMNNRLSPQEQFHSGHYIRCTPKLDFKKEQKLKELEVGAMVYHIPSDNKKFAEKRGPFKIIQKLGSNSYVLEVDGKEVQVARQNVDETYAGA
eukprot:augustus_masked-scaffold_53-processed-gene-1.37-mRNA-1 protein AED:1.00 eAED:1.00 QI:0/-1/0/0/-1/1/1/0/1374